jgi:hypothetical protein
MAQITKKDWFTKAELGLTTTPGGASLIGILDAGTYFSNTNVEGALQEIGLAIGTTIPNTYAKLDCTNQPFTGVVKVNPADGTADPLFEVKTTGTNQYGFNLTTFNLTGLGLGKVPILNWLSNGALTGMGVIESSFLVGDANIPALFGQSIGFLQNSTLMSMVFTANWGSGGFTRIETTSDIYLGGSNTYIGNVTFTDFQTNGSWIDLPAVAGSASGIGSGGAGANCWLGYAGSNGDWLGSGVTAGDICIRSEYNALHLGNSASVLKIAGNYLYINTTTYMSADLDITGYSVVGLVDKIGISIDGGGGAITTGIKGDMQIPYDCEITGVTMLADQTGSIVVDLWVEDYANYPPTVADTITASAKPTITTALKSNDTTLTGWTKTITAGDTIRYNVDSCTTITKCTLILTIKRT